MLSFHRFDPSPCAFPPPRVSVLPRLRRGSLTWRARALDPRARWYRRGRYALAEAYRLAGVGRGGTLLAPAYHCRTMLDPAIALGAPVALYAVKPDLSPDLAAIEAALRTAAVPVKALLVSHFFGFPQPLAALAALCRQHQALLIEDCSHALAGVGGGCALGESGDFAVASPYKFLPTPDGGVLWRGAQPLQADNLRAPPALEQAKAATGVITASLRRRGAAPVAAHVATELAQARTRAHQLARESTTEETAPSVHYDCHEQGTQSLSVTRWLARHTDLDRVARLRREHYQRWLRAVQGLAGCRPLYPAWPDGAVPYMFPLLIDRTGDFMLLKQMGVPIWRWDEMAVSSCATASSYRLHLLHLPCHQELGADELDWMTAAVGAVCGQTHAH